MRNNRISKYGMMWTGRPLQIELAMVAAGGKVKKANGQYAGNGHLFHFLEAIKLAFPRIVLHRWNLRFFEEYLKNRTLGCIGPASSGKTNSAAVCGLIDYYAAPKLTMLICCSTTKEMLENRIWGEIKRLFRESKELHPWLPGNLIEGRQRIVTDARNADSDYGRDFTAGCMGVPCKKGENYVGLGDFAGMKNSRFRLIGDELQLLPAVWVHAISNLDKNPDLKAVGLGNPKDTTDALGIFCEPHPRIGGWDGGVDQGPGMKVWPTKRPQGACIQYPGSDSPNLDGKLGIPLITQEQIDRDVAFYGRDSLWFTMMDEGKMPRGQGTRRVITRQICEKFHAMDQAVWKDGYRTWIGFLDAAYGGVGGDRCVFGTLQFGKEAASLIDKDTGTLLSLNGMASQSRQNATDRVILSLEGMQLVPIKNDSEESPEDQITAFCKKQCEERGIPPENFFFDAGMRSSLVSSMARVWSPKVIPVDFGGQPSARRVSGNIEKLCKDHYSKFVTELWFSVRLTIESGQFRGMTEDVMLEGCYREWTMVAGNKIEIEPKHMMKEKTGRSPDLFDALAIGVEGARQRGFVILKLGNDSTKRSDARWKSDLMKRADRLYESGQLNYAA